MKPFGCGPLMVNDPDVSAPSVIGASWTFPSRTIAVESSATAFWSPDCAWAKYVLYWLVVSVPNVFVAAPSSVRLTTHCVLLVCRPGWIPMSWVPWMTAGPSTYLVPLASQETIWFLTASHWSPASV